MKLTLRISFVTGESKDAIAGPADLVAFEDKFNLSVANLESEMRVTHLLWLAWHSENRQKSTVLEFDAWLDTVESIDPVASKK